MCAYTYTKELVHIIVASIGVGKYEIHKAGWDLKKDFYAEARGRIASFLRNLCF